MAVKIFIRRHCRKDSVESALSLLTEFRKAAMNQPGYLSGVTLLNHYDSAGIAVVSTWRHVEDWIRWQSNEDRAQMETRLEDLLDQPTTYEVFDIHSKVD